MNTGLHVLGLAGLIGLAMPASAVTRYVNLNNVAPVAPYTNWPAAATNIQDAVDVAAAGDLILVSNGVYRTGARTVMDSTPCRLVIDKPVAVRSLNGPDATLIEGFSLPGSFPWSLNSVRCAYVTNGAVLSGFTLTNGSVRATAYVNLANPAGGALCESNAVVTNCVIINCAAYIGGGVQGGILIQCLLTNCVGHIGGGCAYNSILDRCQVVWGTCDNAGGGLYYCQATNTTVLDNLGLYGGGAYGGSFSHCTVFGNYALYTDFGGGYGGGLENANANNCIIYYNTADEGGDEVAGGLFTNCCASYLLDGSGNITNEPQFTGGGVFPGNFHLQSNSPCIDAGQTALVAEPLDLDGRPRVVGAKVDMGAYEFQGVATNDFLTWLADYLLPTDAASDSADPDGDGMNNWREWIAGTVPVDSSSYLRLVSVAPLPPGLAVGWTSVANRHSFLERSTNLAGSPAFTTVATNIPGQAVATFFPDPGAAGTGPFFYRVGVTGP